MSLLNIAKSRQGGMYDPTMILTANLTSASALNLTFTLSGPVVNVVGLITLVPTTGASYELDIPLPIPSDLAGTADIAGISTSVTALDIGSALILGDTVNNSASCVRAANTSDAGHFIYVNFTYTPRF